MFRSSNSVVLASGLFSSSQSLADSKNTNQVTEQTPTTISALQPQDAGKKPPVEPVTMEDKAPSVITGLESAEDGS